MNDRVFKSRQGFLLLENSARWCQDRTSAAHPNQLRKAGNHLTFTCLWPRQPASSWPRSSQLGRRPHKADEKSEHLAGGPAAPRGRGDAVHLPSTALMLSNVQDEGTVLVRWEHYYYFSRNVCAFGNYCYNTKYKVRELLSSRSCFPRIMNVNLHV